MKLFLILLVSAIGLSGCSAVRSSTYSSPVSSTVEADLKANVEIGSKVSGQASSTTLFWLFTFGPNKFVDGVDYGIEKGSNFLSRDQFGTVKSAAAYNAVSQSGADLLIAPKYNIEYNIIFYLIQPM